MPTLPIEQVHSFSMITSETSDLTLSYFHMSCYPSVRHFYSPICLTTVDLMVKKIWLKCCNFATTTWVWNDAAYTTIPSYIGFEKVVTKINKAAVRGRSLLRLLPSSLSFQIERFQLNTNYWSIKKEWIILAKNTGILASYVCLPEADAKLHRMLFCLHLQLFFFLFIFWIFYYLLVFFFY